MLQPFTSVFDCTVTCAARLNVAAMFRAFHESPGTVSYAKFRSTRAMNQLTKGATTTVKCGVLSVGFQYGAVNVNFRVSTHNTIQILGANDIEVADTIVAHFFERIYPIELLATKISPSTKFFKLKNLNLNYADVVAKLIVKHSGDGSYCYASPQNPAKLKFKLNSVFPLATLTHDYISGKAEYTVTTTQLTSHYHLTGCGTLLCFCKDIALNERHLSDLFSVVACGDKSK
jgi:hypothetical protein